MDDVWTSRLHTKSTFMRLGAGSSAKIKPSSLCSACASIKESQRQKRETEQSPSISSLELKNQGWEQTLLPEWPLRALALSIQLSTEVAQEFIFMDNHSSCFPPHVKAEQGEIFLCHHPLLKNLFLPPSPSSLARDICFKEKKKKILKRSGKVWICRGRALPCVLAFYSTCSWRGEKGVRGCHSPLSPSCLHLHKHQAWGCRSGSHIQLVTAKSEWLPPPPLLFPNPTEPPQLVHLPGSDSVKTWIVPWQTVIPSPFHSPPSLSHFLLCHVESVPFLTNQLY